MKTRAKKKVRKAKTVHHRPFSTDTGVSNVVYPIGNTLRVSLDSDRENKRIIIDTIRKLADLL